MPIIYSARWMLPIISSPITNGAIAIDGSQIIAVGPKAEVVARCFDAETLDFGEAAILPGFVNAHSHLELTVMRGFLEDVAPDFFGWLRRLTRTRLAMNDDDLRVSATCGAIEAARAGITCVGDSSSVAVQTMKALGGVGLRGVVYQESFGPDPKLVTENVAKLRDQVAAARGFENGLVRAGVSPHAPYTVGAPQLEMISRMAIDGKLPLMVHAAESEAEKLLLLEGRGPFSEGLRKRGIEWSAPGISSVAYLAQHGILGTKPLLAHCINVDDADLEVIKNSGAGIAHCPKSNAKLGHGRAPFAKFISNGINVGLGSDSVASNNTCDVLEEARFATLLARLPADGTPAVRGGLPLATASPAFRGGLLPATASDTDRPLHDSSSHVISAEQALFAATLGGARALGLDNQIGALAEGMQADITIVRLNGPHQRPVHNPVDTLIFSSSGRDVALTMVAGKEIYRDGRVMDGDELELHDRLAAIRSKLESAVLS